MCSYEEAGPVSALEAEITELAAQIHAATCRWLILVAEFDRRRGWAPWGCRSCAHWISWRCAIAPAAAREHVRVACRLEGLPLVRAAFSAGRLSYSKVRALTRMGEPEREADLLELAEIATAAQLERLVRGYGKVAATERAAATGAPERWVRWREDDDGSLLIQARLPAEEGAVVLKALEVAADRLSVGSPADQPMPAASAEALPASLRPAASAEALPAAVRPSVSAEALPEAVPPAASAEALPASVQPAASGQTPALPTPTPSERRADALVLMADTLLAHEPAARGGDRFQVVVHVDAETLSGEEEGRAELDGGVPLALETARRLACDASIVPLLEKNGRPLSVGRKTRAIPPALRRALASRDRGCRFPGCCERRFVDAHHVEHWARGGATTLTNLVQLCRFHHRLLHEGGYSLEQSPHELVFRRTDGRRIRQTTHPPAGDAARITARKLERNACVPRWAGERLDLDLGVAALLSMAPIAAAPGV